jgi:hypothetical protein
MKPQEALQKIGDLKSDLDYLRTTLHAVPPNLSKAHNHLRKIDDTARELRKNAQLEMLEAWRIQYRKRTKVETFLKCVVIILVGIAWFHLLSWIV